MGALPHPPLLGRTFTSIPSGIVEVRNRSLGGHFPKSAFALWQVRINNCIFFFSILTDCSNFDPSNPYRYSAWNVCTCPWGHDCWSCGSDSCYRPTHPPEACCHWKFGARQVHRGTSEDHTSSRPCFVQDGPTGLLHKCPGLGGADEEFVWNECWPENHQQSALVPWLPCL